MTRNYYGKMATCPSQNFQGILNLPDRTTIRLHSVRGQKWLNDPKNRIFRYFAGERSFTARKETSKTGQADYWYAYRKVAGNLHKRYIGKSEDMSIFRLHEVATALDTSPEPRSTALKTVDVTQDLSVTNGEVVRLQALVEELQRELGNIRSELEAEWEKSPA